MSDKGSKFKVQEIRLNHVTFLFFAYYINRRCNLCKRNTAISRFNLPLFCLHSCPFSPQILHLFVPFPLFSHFSQKKFAERLVSSEKGRTFALAFQKTLQVRAAPSSLGHCRAQQVFDLKKSTRRAQKLDL